MIEPPDGTGGAVWEEFLAIAPIRISGKDVSRVTKYQYLGLIITKGLDIKTMVKHRLEKAENAYRSVFSYVRCPSIPLAARISVFKAIVITTALYGSEIWGMNKGMCNGIQVLINKALRIIIGSCETDMSIPIAAVWRECRVPPIHAMASASRARAINKYLHLNTWISILCKHPVSDTRSTWVSGSMMWMKRRGFGGVLQEKEYEMDSKNGILHEDYGARAQRTVIDELWRRMRTSMANKASESYLTACYGSTSWAGIQAIPAEDMVQAIGIYQGMKMISLCRVGGLWTGGMIAKAFRTKVDPMYRMTCPCCNENVVGGETITHLLLHCHRWEESRSRHIGGLLTTVESMELSVEVRVVLLLGGEYMGHRLEGWLPSGNCDSSDHVIHHGPRRCEAFKLAAFLQEIAGARHAILKEMERTLGSQYSPLQSQGPLGRVSLERQDLG